MDDYLYLIVQYSRGCPHMCDFCDVTTLYGRKPRTKSSEQIIAELDRLNELGNTMLVLFADDNLIGNKRILKKELLPALIAWRKEKNPGFFFATQLTVTLADDEELMDALLEAGFRHIFVGIETPDEKALLVASKKQNLRRNQMDNILRIHEKGFIIAGGFIVGFDTDTEDIFDRQAAFIQKSGIPLPIVNILKAPPGTELFDRLEKEGRINKHFAFAEGDSNIVPVMEEKKLKDGFLRLIADLYLPANSYQRMINFLNTYQRPKTSVKVPENFEMKFVWKLFRLFYVLGIRDSKRQYFWKLLWWTFWNKRKHMDKALLFGTMIYQMHHTYLHIKKSVESDDFSSVV